MSRQDDLAGFAPLQQIVPPGITNAVLISDPAYSVGGAIEYVSGGSLLIMRAPGQVNGTYGSTYSGAELIAGYSAGQFWKVGAGALNYNGAARYYLAATGATASCQLLRGLSAGYKD